MAKATFVSGNPVMRDYTPSGAAVSAGDIVIIGNRPYVAHKDIADGELGALACGGGIYDLVKDNTSGPNITDGQEVYWISADTLATNVSEDNYHFGPAVGAAGASTTPVRAYHSPNGTVVNEST